MISRSKPASAIWPIISILPLPVTSIAGQKPSESNHNWVDVFIGGRYHTAFGKKWLFTLRGDVGVGGSQLAWFGNAMLGYQVSELFALGFRF